MTREEFAEKWQSQHYPTMDLQAEMPFYYDIYQKICSVAKEGCKKINEFYVIQILMYVENMGHLRLDDVYARLYRRSEDMVGHWCGLMKLPTPTVKEIRKIVDEAIGTAPKSGLVKWTQECVASQDFNNLKSVALFFAHADLAVGLLLPNSHYREEVYLQLFNENDRIASNMVSSDFAFNWKDKEGYSVMQRLAHCFERMGDAVTAHSLSSVQGIRLNCYRVVASEDGKLTLMNKDNEQYSPVVVTTPIPNGHRDMCFICQMVGWNGEYYINGAGMWMDMAVYERWDNQKLWDGIEEDERDDCSCSYFTTPSGENVSCYEDAYGEEDPDDVFGLDDIWGSDWGDTPGFYLGEDPIESEAARKRKRNKEEGRKQPNYKYKPTGKSPSLYFTRKINEVFKWTVEDSTDLNYGLRVLEGWMRQAHVYIEDKNYAYGHFIASSIVFSGANYSDCYMADYPKQASRMKKIVRDGYEVVMETLSHDPSNWREVFAQTLKQLKSYNWEIFKGKGAFDLEKAIKDVESMLKK